MIQANELRIGNWLADKQNRKGKVIELTPRTITVKMPFSKLKDTYIGKSAFKGIPITEDILLKAGFEKNGSYKEIKLNQVSITIKLLDGEYFLVDASGWYGKGFIYLHSLQNLIYALTGTELTINL